MQAKPARAARIFDTITLERKDSDGSIWKGGKGIYIIRHTEQQEKEQEKEKKKVPVAKVILNHEFLTGLFRSTRPAIFTGDVRQGGRRLFMLFHVKGVDCIEIHVQE